MNEQFAIGIDLGATNIKGVLINTQGYILEQETCVTQEQGEGSGWQAAVADLVKKLKKKSAYPVHAIGLSAPGIPNETNTCIAFMPGRLYGLENFIWSAFLKEKDVRVLNDANAALLAETYFGAGKGIQNIIMLTLGTGVGGSILINGTLYQGFGQMAGHFGHTTVDADGKEQGITGMVGSLEDALGDATIGKRSYGKFSSTKALAAAYHAGDTFATYLWLDAVRKLAVGLSSLCNVLSPEMIILGGGMVKAEAALMKPLTDFMDIYEWRPGGKQTKIAMAHYQDFAGAIGAAVFAFQQQKILQ